MKNPYEKTVLGVGYYGKRIDGTIPSCVNNEGTLSREYIHWSGMIHRCFNKKIHENRPTYADCTIDEKLLEFAYFLDHVHEIENYEEWKKCPNEKWHLDKDSKYLGNKHYSINNCTFLKIGDNSKEVFERYGNPNPYINNNFILGMAINRNDFIIETSPIRIEEKYGLDASSIRKCCNGKRRSCGGYQWFKLTLDDFIMLKDNIFTPVELCELFQIENYSRELPEETRKKMKENHADFTGSKNPKAKKVVCLNTSQVFGSAKEASEWCGGNVKQNCQGKSKSAGRHPMTGEKLRWMYYEEWLNITDVATV